MRVRATYRLQLRPGFGFDAAAAVVPYLVELGISHVYLSPFLQAGTGSTHGYDVVDHRRLNVELGGEEGYARLCAALDRAGLRQVVDIVPNHMSIAEPERNPWWWDVLENGPASIYAGHFDVDWKSPESRMHDRVLVPILGEPYGRVLKAGDIRLLRDGAAIVVCVYDRRLPVAPISLGLPLGRAAAASASDELAHLADAFAALPAPTVTDIASRARRQRDKAVLARYLARLLEEHGDVAAAIDDEIARINASPEELHALLERQNYRLAYWRAARQDLDYRRFFDINELAGLRTEDPIVFAATHERILEGVRQGVIDGLRVDHPDGLRDPDEYLARLRNAAPSTWIVAEKILGADEPLPSSWPIDGTTGYDFLNRVGGLFVDPASEPAFDDLWEEFSEATSVDFAITARAKKHVILRELLGSDLARLTEVFVHICEARLDFRDYSRDQLRAALEESLVQMPVYRTYVRADGIASDRDREIIDGALDAAAAARPDLDAEIFALLREVLGGDDTELAATELRSRFQQLSSTTMAKGVEDTAFFTHHRLICLNEVGGEPGHFGSSVAAFHCHCLRIQRDWPTTMTALTTHDTKRSEDARLRVAALSEIPERWAAAVRGWSRRNEHLRCDGLPDRATEYLLYQTLVAAWPIDAERLGGFMLKAVREAKTQTSWTRTNAAYEEALLGFCRDVLADRVFVAELGSFVVSLLPGARRHSLAQRLLQLCAPGVPDVYQGAELWDDSLTDPDNRRPVDFDLRRHELARMAHMTAAQVMAELESGLPKLWLVRRVLALRARRPEAFGAEGDYAPIEPCGAEAHRLIAFARGDAVVVASPRLLVGFDGDWGDTVLPLPAGSWKNDFDGETYSGDVPAGRLFAEFPGAVLERCE